MTQSLAGSGISPEPESRPLALVALGSNLGDSAVALRHACQRLRERSAGEFQASSLWRTTPVNCPPGSPPFCNGVVLFRAAVDETPESLLETLQKWEREAGRPERHDFNAPRVLDLDLLAFGDQVRASRELTLPHPRAHLRRFVLAPLNELAPKLVLPGWSHAAGDYLAALEGDEVVVRVGPMCAEAPGATGG